MRLVAAGVSHRAAPLRVRERAAASVTDPPTMLRYLLGHAGLSGAALLNTCNRTEFYVACRAGAAPLVAERLSRYLDPSGDGELSAHFVARYDADAVRHLFRVAAGLESMLVGEPQVLGQLKEAHRVARQAGTLDARLDFVLRRAITVGKQVRTATAFLGDTATLGEAAIDHAANVLGDLRSAGVLLLGAGAVSRAAAQRVELLGAHLFCASRSHSAEALAQAHGGEAVGLERIADVAARVDVVITSTSSARAVLGRVDIERIQRTRAYRPLLVVDLAVPRDVDPDARNVAGVTLIDIDQVGRTLQPNDTNALAPTGQAEEIIAAELVRTLRALDDRESVSPTIAALQQRAERVRREELERTLARVPHLDAATRGRIDAMTQSMMRKLLHAPIAHLRETRDDPAVALTLREAFDLES